MVLFPLTESVGVVCNLAVFGIIIYLRPATMAIDCGAERSCSFAVALSSLDDDFTFVSVVDLVNAFANGSFFIGRIGVVVNCPVEFEFTILFSVCCSLLAVAAVTVAAAAACAFWAASFFSRLQCYTRKHQYRRNY